MAITRLTDIITVFDSKWTYGDVKFGYDGEVNQDHDTQYPLMLVNPPESTIPAIYDGREEYSFEINFYNLYSQAAKDVVTLQKRWDNLQDLSNEWLDMVLKNYQDVTVEAYLNDESIEIERVKDTNNDKLVQIKLTFTMSAFTKCFRPTSNYPSDFTDLVVWLRADSGVTFDIPTKRVSVWRDNLSNSSDVAQATTTKQPLRYGYGGQNDKAYFSFDGTNDLLISSKSSPLGADFTLFEVSKGDSVNSTIFSYDKGVSQIGIKLSGSGSFSAFLYDGANSINVNTGNDNLNKNHIGIIKKSNQTVDLEYYDSQDTLSGTATNASYNGTLEYNQTSFTIGASLNISNVGSLFLDGNLQEVIVYNRALSDAEIADVRGYLNLKYKIY